MAEKIYANKALGQHFLTSSKVIEAIVTDFSGLYETIIEVGPGAMAITKSLCKIEKPFFVIEKDTRFKELYSNHLEDSQVIFTDALCFDFDQFIEIKNLQGPIWLVSNLPYNISTPLFIKFLQCEAIKYMTLMFQKEVALKIFPDQRKKNQLASLNILAKNYCDISKVVEAPPGAFSPPLKVDSLVINFT